MNITSSCDKNHYYGCTDDANCINDYDGVEDYYADYYGDIDDNDDLMVQIVNCKFTENYYKKTKQKDAPFNNLKQIFGMKFHFNHSLIVYVIMYDKVFISISPINTFIQLCILDEILF